jgi:hypothetical protein
MDYNTLAYNLDKILVALDNGTANPAKVQRALVVAIKAVCQNLDKEDEPIQEQQRPFSGPNPFAKSDPFNFGDLFGGKK